MEAEAGDSLEALRLASLVCQQRTGHPAPKQGGM